MSKLIKRLIAISAAFVPAFAAMQVQAATHHQATALHHFVGNETIPSLTEAGDLLNAAPWRRCRGRLCGLNI
ncbi:MAG: hypothetical protein JF606_18570 [Burkholderiales bacterium]|jgi:hypothetical protein|nr:hypothetical protein [Burkholderiales bacterium]